MKELVDGYELYFSGDIASRRNGVGIIVSEEGRKGRKSVHIRGLSI